MTEQPEPICKFPQGCHLVVTCNPGCGASLPTVEQPVRHTADTITDNDLDQLYAELRDARLAADRYFHNGLKAVGRAQWRAHAAEQRAEQAEAANSRVRALHRPAEYMGRIICAECSAYCGESTDNPPAPMPCPTVSVLAEPKEPRP